MEDRCVCCGAIVPEGQMVCSICMADTFAGKKTDKISRSVRLGVCQWKKKGIFTYWDRNANKKSRE